MFEQDKYDKILEKLDYLIKGVKEMVETQAQLDAAIAANTTAVSQLVSDTTANTAAVNQLVADVTALITALQAAGTPDFTNEVNAIQASMAQVTSTDAAVQASTTALQGSDTSAESELNPPPAPAS